MAETQELVARIFAALAVGLIIAGAFLHYTVTK